MISYTKKNSNLLVNWLSLSITLILFMIVIGGLTRLTDSGLSITDWELLKGIFPPFKESIWLSYFEEYKNIPQYKMINQSMTLDEFKVIFYWEYFHRLLGRCIGLIFLIPLLYFSFVKKIPFKELKIFYFIFLLVILQGIMGWYMVMSGLVNDVTVSHYRLSLHLSLAIIITLMLYWQWLNLRLENNKVFFRLSKKRLPYIFLILIILSQIIIGAFVSGLDAGKIYQTWPLMGLNYFPDDINFVNSINLFDLSNHSLVQFYHRNVAYFITVYILILSFFTMKEKKQYLNNSVYFLLSVVLIQVFLGIITLLSNLHIVLASAHQITSVVLILSAVNLYYRIIK